VREDAPRGREFSNARKGCVGTLRATKNAARALRFAGDSSKARKGCVGTLLSAGDSLRYALKRASTAFQSTTFQKASM
jgi:hypothetical protein